MTKFFDSISYYSKYNNHKVQVGNIVIGGTNHIVCQSMATTSTLDIEKSIEQAKRIFEAQAEMVRFTASSIAEAKALKDIRDGLNSLGYNKPIVADVHFNPSAAFEAAQNVEKVRINPGNFVDKRSGESNLVSYTEEEYNLELNRLNEKLSELIEICKRHNTALRIGVNHGSLSERIMSRYGDTPLGMCHAALEFLRICKEHDFTDVVVSMKSSNVKVMVIAYRMLVALMKEENINFPLHLGVTEAGESEDGRIKSAVGIGALLSDGIGDTIRVSLTEDPEFEIPVARKLASYFEDRDHNLNFNEEVNSQDYYGYGEKLWDSKSIGNIGGDSQPVVIMPDFKYDGNLTPADYSSLSFAYLQIDSLDRIKSISNSDNRVLIFTPQSNDIAIETRLFFLKLIENRINLPVIIRLKYNETDSETLSLKAAADCGSVFIDGFGDGLWIDNANNTISKSKLIDISYSILQSTRRRITKTEFISCPGCGRTLFDIQKSVKEVKQRLSHYKGIKIAVMGCIVNGPGEMADADFGYVGAGEGYVNLYKGKELVVKRVPETMAVDSLINLIEKENL